MPNENKDVKKASGSLFDSLKKHLGVMTDFGAMKLADTLVNFVINHIEKNHSVLGQKLILAAKNNTVVTQTILITLLQAIFGAIKPILPRELGDIGEDFVAKIPTSVSEAIRRLAAKPTPTGVTFEERDLDNLQRELTQKLTGQVAGPLANTFSNFAFFTMLLDDAQLTTFYSGIQNLDEKERRHLGTIFNAMKPQQIEQVLRRLPRNATIGKDWSLLFGIFQDMGLISEEKKEEHKDPVPQEGEVLKTILALDDAVKRTRVLEFLGILNKDKSGLYQLAINRMAGWTAEDFSHFCLLPNNDLMASLLGLTLPKEFPDSKEKESFLAELFEKVRKHRADGREKDRRQGKRLADQAVTVVKGDPRLSGIVPLFEGFASLFNKPVETD